jgi:hypothetical protein
MSTIEELRLLISFLNLRPVTALFSEVSISSLAVSVVSVASATVTSTASAI